MMHGREKSDSAIVAGKPTNKAAQSAAELVERRAGTESPGGLYNIQNQDNVAVVVRFQRNFRQ
jgi:RNA-directed DNA polymerase